MTTASEFFATGGIDGDTARLLQRYGFDHVTFEQLQERLRRGEAGDAHNRITDEVVPPAVGDVKALPPIGSDSRAALHQRGAAAIRDGHVAAVVLAGGMATRFGGLVKAAVEVIPEKSFLALKIDDIRRTAAAVSGRVPVFV